MYVIASASLGFFIQHVTNREDKAAPDLSVSKALTVLEPKHSLKIILRYKNPQAHVTNHPSDYDLSFLFFLFHTPICFHLPFYFHGRVNANSGNKT
jgi:hypothetical protein